MEGFIEKNFQIILIIKFGKIFRINLKRIFIKMFNYSSNYRDWIIRPERPMSKSNVTSKIRSKKSSQPKSNFSTVTAKREPT